MIVDSRRKANAIAKVEDTAAHRKALALLNNISKAKRVSVLDQRSHRRGIRCWRRRHCVCLLADNLAP